MEEGVGAGCEGGRKSNKNSQADTHNTTEGC